MTTQILTPTVLQNSVVVLSQAYLPLARINIKRAIALLVAGRAESLELGETQYWTVRSAHLNLQVPEYIRLLQGGTHRMWKVPPVNRRNVLKRDGHACQYCGSTKHLTLDHVIPRAQGGPHSWENVVTACEPCNSRKGDKTPAQAGMTLKTKPKAPAHPAVAFAEEFWKDRA